jgi:hypothetical protein
MCTMRGPEFIKQGRQTPRRIIVKYVAGMCSSSITSHHSTTQTEVVVVVVVKRMWQREIKLAR